MKKILLSLLLLMTFLHLQAQKLSAELSEKEQIIRIQFPQIPFPSQLEKLERQQFPVFTIRRGPNL